MSRASQAVARTRPARRSRGEAPPDAVGERVGLAHAGARGASAAGTGDARSASRGPRAARRSSAHDAWPVVEGLAEVAVLGEERVEPGDERLTPRDQQPSRVYGAVVPQARAMAGVAAAMAAAPPCPATANRSSPWPWIIRSASPGPASGPAARTGRRDRRPPGTGQIATKWISHARALPPARRTSAAAPRPASLDVDRPRSARTALEARAAPRPPPAPITSTCWRQVCSQRRTTAARSSWCRPSCQAK